MITSLKKLDAKSKKSPHDLWLNLSSNKYFVFYLQSPKIVYNFIDIKDNFYKTVDPQIKLNALSFIKQNFLQKVNFFVIW